MATKSEVERDEDGMRKEYDAAFWKGAEVGKYADRLAPPGSVMISIERDVLEVFPDATAVNEALRTLIHLQRSLAEQRRSA